MNKSVTIVPMEIRHIIPYQVDHKPSYLVLLYGPHLGPIGIHNNLCSGLANGTPLCTGLNRVLLLEMVNRGLVVLGKAIPSTALCLGLCLPRFAVAASLL